MLARTQEDGHFCAEEGAGETRSIWGGGWWCNSALKWHRLRGVIPPLGTSPKDKRPAPRFMNENALHSTFYHREYYGGITIFPFYFTVYI